MGISPPNGILRQWIRWIYGQSEHYYGEEIDDELPLLCCCLSKSCITCYCCRQQINVCWLQWKQWFVSRTTTTNETNNSSIISPDGSDLTASDVRIVTDDLHFSSFHIQK